MKHGHKAKAKAKASSEKSKTAAKTKAEGKKISVAPSTKKSSSPRAAENNGKNRGRVGTEGVNFSNPLVAAAFKRAVKKYSVAFRRLTD
jgi:hypothetical protein